MTIDVHNGLFNRVLQLFGVIKKIKKIPSDEEVEGLLAVLPRESQANIGTFFEPEVREAGMTFLKMFMAWLFQAQAAREQGKKIILVPFNFPPELVMAFENAVPLTTEVLTTVGAIALEGGGERYWDYMMSLGLPDHICSSNSIEIGSVLSETDLPPDAIISAAPGACDANSKIHEFLSHHLDIPQFVLEKPVDDSPEGHALYNTYYRKLIHDLESFIGERIDEHKLRTLLTKANRCAELYWELFDMHKAKPSPVPNIFQVFLPTIRFCMWGTDLAIEALEAMVRCAKGRLFSRDCTETVERARVLWAYTSYYFNIAELHQWMGKRGYTFLADILGLYLPKPYDVSSLETMIDGLVATAWDYPMNRQMAAGSMSEAWVRDMVFVAKELSADCLIHCGHDACKQTWSVVSILKDELMKRAGIPLLILHGDSWMKTTTPISVIQENIEEFLSSVVLNKNKKVKRRVRRREAPMVAE